MLPVLAVLFCLGGSPAHGQEKPSAAQIAEWRKDAEKGVATAQFKFGWCYAHGQGVAQNDAEAVKWCRKAAEQGYALAQITLGAATPQEQASRRTRSRRSNGAARLLNRVMPMPNPTSHFATPTVKA